MGTGHNDLTVAISCMLCSAALSLCTGPRGHYGLLAGKNKHSCAAAYRSPAIYSLLQKKMFLLKLHKLGMFTHRLFFSMKVNKLHYKDSVNTKQDTTFRSSHLTSQTAFSGGK